MTSNSPARPAADSLAREAVRSPDAVSLWLSDGSWTYLELERAAARLARALHGLGLGPGAVIAALLESDATGLLALHGAFRADAVLAVGHPAWSAVERTSYLAALGPEAVVMPRGGPVPEPAVVAESATETIALTGPHRAELQLDIHVAPPGRLVTAARRAELGDRGVDLLLWTSGTEGRPRIACHGWPGLAAAARAANRRVSFGSGDRWLASLALAHIGGLAVPIRAVEAGAAVAVSEPQFDPERTWRLLERSHATHVSLVPAMLRRLLDFREDGPPPALRCALVGGDAASSPLVRRALAAGWPLALTYGLTEAGSQVATAPPELVRRKPGTVGAPLEGFEVRIGDAGEIRVRGPGIMKGYLAGDGSRPVPPDEWLETGDIGEVDDEGHLWVSGRDSSRIVSGGATVDPGEVESVLRSHEAVEEAAVIGVPDDTWGERVAAVIVPATGTARAGGELQSELEAWASRRLSGPRKPRIWVIVKSLPRTATGKPDRSALRSMAAAAVERTGPPAAPAGRRPGPAASPPEPATPGE